MEAEVEYDEPTVIFEIKANYFGFTFTFKSPMGVETPLGEGESSLLSTEVAGGLTGLFFGMYATGNGKESTTPAHFDYFNYVPLDSSKTALSSTTAANN